MLKNHLRSESDLLWHSRVLLALPLFLHLKYSFNSSRMMYELSKRTMYISSKKLGRLFEKRHEKDTTINETYDYSGKRGSDDANRRSLVKLTPKCNREINLCDFNTPVPGTLSRKVCKHNRATYIHVILTILETSYIIVTAFSIICSKSLIIKNQCPILSPEKYFLGSRCKENYQNPTISWNVI
ncbi:hypothetical protein AGLY_001556, partial [Aphis glycines]